MVIEWTKPEDDIIRKHAKDKQHKNKAAVFAAASVEIMQTLGIERSTGAVGQRYSKAKLGKKTPSTEIMVIKPHGSAKLAPTGSMAFNVAVMAILKLNPQERLALVDKMLNNEL